MTAAALAPASCSSGSTRATTTPRRRRPSRSASTSPYESIYDPAGETLLAFHGILPSQTIPLIGFATLLVSFVGINFFGNRVHSYAS